ncbi:MAG: aldehyde ferredoxin oxidoreductase N-terminal domain-containing protein [Anaerolineae bacterium]
MSSHREDLLRRNYLRVDLSTGKLWTQQVDPDMYRRYLGGTCFGARILYDEVPPGTEWSAPENRVIIASGPLGGTAVNGSGAISVVTKGPMTNGAAASQANGFMGAFLRLNGFDGVVIQGAAPSWVYLHIEDGRAELRDAGHLAGVDTWELIDRLTEELGVDEKRLSIFGIGPAGENLVRFAALVGDRGHVAGHNGIGAVLGSKRLKAIVARRAPGTVPVHNRQALTEIAKRMISRIADDPVKRELTYRWGTLLGVAAAAHLGTWLPVKNYTTSLYNIPDDILETWNGPYIRAHYDPRRHNCWGCRFQHCTLMTVPQGPYKGFVGEEPEYEQWAAFGPQIGNTDPTGAFVLADETDRLGFENNEMGWLVGLLMECYEKGVLTREQLDGLDLRWGNVEAVRTLLGKIARREGIGDLLAEGTMRVAQKLGGEALKFAIHAMKGNTPRGHDHRARWTELMDTVTSNTGTMEVGSTFVIEEDVLRQIGADRAPGPWPHVPIPPWARPSWLWRAWAIPWSLCPTSRAWREILGPQNDATCSAMTWICVPPWNSWP